jgi:hypothetical protein
VWVDYSIREGLNHQEEVLTPAMPKFMVFDMKKVLTVRDVYLFLI